MACALLATSALAVTATVASAAAQSNAVHRFEIPAQPLLRAIAQFNRQSGVQITAEGGLVSDRATAAVSGDYQTSEALGVMLSGTGLAWRWIDDRTVALEPLGRVASGNVLVASFSAGGGAEEAAAAETGAQVLPEVVADGERADESYVMGTGAEAGTTRITEKEIRARAPGSGDANQILKAMPTVQFRRITTTSQEDIQDIRPTDISISGGRYYENLITIDGVDANTRVDVIGGDPTNPLEISGASPQTAWFDTNLVGEITLRDSNISAEYGRFTGGALDIKTRSPKRDFGFTSTVSYTSDALTNFKMAKGSREAIGEGEMPERPAFEKWRYGVTMDLPVSKDVGLLLGYNRSRADVVYTRGSAYGSTRYGQSSVSDNFLAKAEADVAPDIRLSGQLSYTPYESEASSGNGIRNEIVTHGGGIVSKLELAKSGETNWSVSAGFTRSNTGREAPPDNYSVPSWSTDGNVCSNTNCTIGGFGNLKQWQSNYTLTGRWSAPLGPGRLAMGFDYQRIEAMRSRAQDGHAYQQPTVRNLASTISCAETDSLSCVTGEYALTQYQLYQAYRARVNLDSVAGWAEYSADLGRLSLRAGLRYDYESFLGNHNFSPRLSATYSLPWDGWSVTLGANRYFGRSMLAYALREKSPDSFTYRRGATSQGGTYSDADWYMSRTSRTATYSDGKKKTPYSNELSAALSARILGGSLRLKGIYREGKDEFIQSEGEELTKVLADGKTVTYTNHVVTNDGYSKYRGLSVEWTRSFGKHSFAFSTNFSKTSSTNDDYFVDVGDVTDNPLVAFQGRVVSYADILSMTQRDDMAVPFMANMTWTALWLSDRVTTNVNLRYTDKVRRIEETAARTTIDGVTYDVWDYVTYPRSLDVNLNAQAEVIRSSYGVLTADVRVANLFDRLPSPNSLTTSNPYQFGRSFWVGLNYRF